MSIRNIYDKKVWYHGRERKKSIDAGGSLTAATKEKYKVNQSWLNKILWFKK
jgi:hypothetical protein